MVCAVWGPRSSARVSNSSSETAQDNSKSFETKQKDYKTSEHFQQFVFFTDIFCLNFTKAHLIQINFDCTFNKNDNQLLNKRQKVINNQLRNLVCRFL